MSVRAAVAADVPAVLEAYAWLMAPPGSVPPGWDPQAAAGRLGELVGSPGTFCCFLAEDLDGRLLGFCTVALDLLSVRFGQRAWVEDLAVHPDHRSDGHGARLLDAAAAWAAERGASHLELDSGDARTDAHRFYLRRDPSWTSRCFGWRLQP